ncbi:hypothetical protein GQ55_5G015400 [Panicum hallii var. hallii]|uniref:Uncharacterized protein n=1 Tax=Panicum hallii var. hallii TaxID=1504633 RepID=A0A2T7DBR1_9POAL|nr:hypothetical protein GQ55_5G015400 [Panicum hallii var. hallii]
MNRGRGTRASGKTAGRGGARRRRTRRGAARHRDDSVWRSAKGARAAEWPTGAPRDADEAASTAIGESTGRRRAASGLHAAARLVLLAGVVPRWAASLPVPARRSGGRGATGRRAQAPTAWSGGGRKGMRGGRRVVGLTGAKPSFHKAFNRFLDGKFNRMSNRE